MKCEECPFHLPCFMGRLGGGRGDEKALCPDCGKLEILGENDETRAEPVIRVYRFHCELRVATPEIRSKFQRNMRTARSKVHLIAEVRIKDPVDNRRLKVAECLECCKSPLRLIAHVRIVDLDADWEDEERRKRHVFRLRTTRKDQG